MLLLNCIGIKVNIRARHIDIYFVCVNCVIILPWIFWFHMVELQAFNYSSVLRSDALV